MNKFLLSLQKYQIQSPRGFWTLYVLIEVSLAITGLNVFHIPFLLGIPLCIMFYILFDRYVLGAIDNAVEED